MRSARQVRAGGQAPGCAWRGPRCRARPGSSCAEMATISLPSSRYRTSCSWQNSRVIAAPRRHSSGLEAALAVVHASVHDTAVVAALMRRDVVFLLEHGHAARRATGWSALARPPGRRCRRRPRRRTSGTSPRELARLRTLPATLLLVLNAGRNSSCSLLAVPATPAVRYSRCAHLQLRAIFSLQEPR